MVRALLAALVVSLMLFFSACITPTTTYYVSPNSPMSYGFVSKATIKDGEKLAEKYPDESFVYNNITTTYTFLVDEKLLKKGDKTKTKKKSRKSKDGEVEDDDEAASIDKSGVQVEENVQQSVVALEDMMRYEDALFFDGSESISTIKATYADDPSTEFTVASSTQGYEDNGIFHSDLKVKYFSLPMYVVGNSAQINYTRKYNDYRYFTSVYLNENHPCQEKIISFEIPEGLEVEFIEMNFDGYTVTKTEGELPAKKKKKSSSNRNSKKETKDKKKKKSKKESNTKKINYTITNSPGSKSERNILGPSYNMPHLLILCKSYVNGSDTIKLMGNNDDLYKWYSLLAGRMENKNTEIKALSEKLIADKTTDEEKISAIFYWVQDNIRYIAFEDGIAAFKPDECQNVYKKRYGDCKGMANLTKEMLKSVGYDARLTWIGTRRIAYNGAYPTISGANHMICAVYLDNKERYFLDPTETYVSFGDYAHRIQGRKVVIENGQEYILDSVPEFDYRHNTISANENLKLEGRELVGEVTEVYNGESKINLLRSYNGSSTDMRERGLRTFLNGNDFNLSVNNIKHTDFKDRIKPFEITYGLRMKNHVLTEGNNIYINVERERPFSNFSLDTGRVNHYSFGFKRHITQKTVINIPQGASIVRIPEEVNITNPYFTFKARYTKQGATVVYEKELIIPQGYLDRKEIKTWNEAVEKLTAFYDNYLIIKK